MKKKQYKLFIFCVLVLFQVNARAQYILKEADAQFELFNYGKAIDIYEQAYKKKPSLYAAERLGECYALMHNYKQTESWYAIACRMDNAKPEDFLLYAKALQNNSKYTEASITYKKYFALNKEVALATQSLLLLSCDSAIKWMKNPVKVDLVNRKNINSSQSDWGAVEYQNGVVFTSDRSHSSSENLGIKKSFLKFDGPKAPQKNIYGWTGNGYLRLYTFFANDSIKLFPLKFGTDYHIGSASFTADGNEIFFTLTKIPSNLKFENGKLATVNIEIYSSKKDVNGNWDSPQPFKYNNVNKYSVGDPFITKDGNSLYFTSNMVGGKGGTDLYVCFKTDTGEWGVPVNLSEINTEGNERCPFFDDENNFYFSTDGRIGMGGLDIFKALLDKGKISEPKNLGYPVNSPQDDFSFFSNDQQKGYFASNRNDGAGSDDIYQFTKQAISTYKLVGNVFDKKTGLPLTDAILTLTKIGGGSIKIQTDQSGSYSFNLSESSVYKLTGEKTNFRNNDLEINTKDLTSSKNINRNLYLEQIEIDKPIRIENIYYDFDKSNIRADAKIELDKLVKIMQDNPTIWIELGSHTDSRGNDQYNQWLSQSRANAAVQYIIDRGISKNRITAKGYGESVLLNHCANGIKCTETEHQLNRRTEFKIVKQ